MSDMSENLEQLDLLLLQLPKSRKVHSNGIHFQGFRYINPNLVAYIGKSVLVRYDPTNLNEIRVFHKNFFLCTCISPELSDYSIDIQDIASARNKCKNNLFIKKSAI